VQYEGAPKGNNYHPNEDCCFHASVEAHELDEVSKRVANRIDLPKIQRLPEPRRTAQWLRMFYVPCNGDYEEFEVVYEDYCICLQPRRISRNSPNSPNSPNTPLGGLLCREQRQPDSPPQDDQVEENDTREQQTPTAYQKQTRAKQRSKKYTTVGPPTRSEFLRTLSNTLHGVRVYSPEGRIQSWSEGDDPQDFKFLMLGFCIRKKPLTLASTNREANRRQLQWYRDKGDITDPIEKRTEFARKLADDPLFMLPKGVESRWREREIRRLREFSHDDKAVQDAGFPGVSLEKKQFFVKKDRRRKRAGPSAQNTGSDEMSGKLTPTRRSGLDADEQPVITNGKAKKEEGSREPQMGTDGEERQEDDSQDVPLASSPRPTTSPPDPSCAAGPKRERVPDVIADLVLSPSGRQSDSSDIRDPARRAVVANASEVRESSQLVKSYNSPIVKAETEEVPGDIRELAGELAKLGIKSDLPP